MKACLIVIVFFLHFTCYSSSEDVSHLTNAKKQKLTHEIRNFFYSYVELPLDEASQAQFIEKNRKIIAHLPYYKHLDLYKNSLLHYAVNQHKDVAPRLIRFLLHHEKSLNSKNVAGATPLHIAAIAGAHNSCKILLEQQDLDRSIRDDNGYLAGDHAQRKEEKMRSLFLP